MEASPVASVKTPIPPRRIVFVGAGLLAAGGAIGFISLFLDWFVPETGATFTPDLPSTGFEQFGDDGSLRLGIATISAIVIAAVMCAIEASPDLRENNVWFLLGAGLQSFSMVVGLAVTLIDPPTGAEAGSGLRLAIGAAAVAVTATAVIAFGVLRKPR